MQMCQSVMEGHYQDGSRNNVKSKNSNIVKLTGTEIISDIYVTTFCNCAGNLLISIDWSHAM